MSNLNLFILERCGVECKGSGWVMKVLFFTIPAILLVTVVVVIVFEDYV